MRGTTMVGEIQSAPVAWRRPRIRGPLLAVRGLLLAALLLALTPGGVAAAIDDRVQEPAAPAAAPHRPAGEASLVLPDLTAVTFVGGLDGWTLLSTGLVVTLLGFLFGLVIF